MGGRKGERRGTLERTVLLTIVTVSPSRTRICHIV